MNKLHLLEKPVQLKQGETGLFRVGAAKKVITIVSDDCVVVRYTLPLKPSDTTIYSAPKSAVFCALSSLSDYSHLAMPTKHDKAEIFSRRLGRRPETSYGNIIGRY